MNNKDNEIIRYISLFSGIGGFEYGIQQSRYKDKLVCLAYSEIDKYADSIYRKRFPSRVVKGLHTHHWETLQKSGLPTYQILNYWLEDSRVKRFLLQEREEGLMTQEELCSLKSPVECERLQGFPDGWTEFGADGEPISNTQRYKCLGNAVTTNVITHIFNNWDLI